jgi:hypothetical protein
VACHERTGVGTRGERGFDTTDKPFHPQGWATRHAH